MRKLCAFLTAFLFIGSLNLLAQQTVRITGTVTSADGAWPLQGVTVVVVGSTTGTVTNMEGRYEITVPAIAKKLRFSYIGYRTVEVDISGRTVIDVEMQEEAIEVKEVTVTALGIMRAEKATGYAIQSVKGDELARTPELNIVNSLQGRISGAIITNTSGAVGASTRIVLRGVNSLSTDNQPLFVVDGVVLNNTNFGATYTEGVNRGSGIADINPNDIESVTVLKGPNAAALYGSRAANGVIIIKTRSADTDKRFGVSFNSTTTFERPLRLPDFQNVYGQGTNGQFEFYDGKGGGINDHVDESWGPKLDIGLMIPQWNSPVVGGVRQPTPWVSHPDNVKNFFELGKTFSNNIAIESAAENYAVRFSYTNSMQTGMIPNTDQEKNSVNLNATASPYKFLAFTANATYINTYSKNLPAYGYSGQNVMQQFMWFGRQVDVADLKQYKYPDGSKRNWNYSYHNNPYFTLYENLNGIDRDRLLGQATSTIKFTDWLSLKTGIGVDYYTNYNNARSAYGDIESPFGFLSEAKRTFREVNTDFMFMINKSFTEKLAFSLNFGGSRMDQFTQSLSAYTTELSVPDVYTFENARVPVVTMNYITKKRINSLYFNGQFAWKNALFFDFTGRNDWSSTLPAGSNAYFYPSVNVSAVLTDLFDIQSRKFSFAKLRAGWAQVGADTDPYQLQPVYRFDDGWNSGTKLAQIYIPNDLPNPNLKPQRTNSFEIGADLRFFMNRLAFDLTYYSQSTYDQIIRMPISATTGYTSTIVNAGQIDNRGVELSVNGIPVKTRSGFEWNIGINFSRNVNKVRELAEGLDQYVLGGYWSLDVLAIPGEPFGVLYGYDFMRNDEGKVIHIAGLPLQGVMKKLGNYTPDWVAGVTNSIRFKNLTFSALVDARWGGEIYSMTNTWGRYAGVLKETLKGREGGIVGVGVMPDGQGRWTENDVVVSAEEYNKAAYNNNIAYSSIFDASFIKLREVQIGYTIPKIGKSSIRNVSISIVGRNLAILYARVPHIDPETAFSNSNVQGLEFGQHPTARSLGVNFSFKF